MSEQKYYVVGVASPEVWEYVHSVLTQDGSLDDNIPSRPIECTDIKDHSPTRTEYLMTEQEADLLRQHPDVKFVELEKSRYRDQFPPEPDKLHCMPTRYNASVYNYRNIANIPLTATSAQLNRAGFQLLRCAQYANPWAGVSPTTILGSDIPNSNTGKNIDVIVGDDGCWFGHAEFANNTGSGPVDYVGGNKLPGNGTCDLLDVVLDGPYYIDPAWFDANPGSRLTTRWDGTRVPIESIARAWWSDATQRSPEFASAGTVAIPSYYTRANCNGSGTQLSAEGNHGTACCGQAFGRTYGWAYNANKWFIDAYGTYGLWPVDNYFDVMKIFHLTKPVNPIYGTKDPTISSNSWGFRASIPSTGYYYFRTGTSGAGGVAYSGTKPQFMYWLGSAGDASRAKGDMLANTLTTAGDELIASGVIFVVAAGNSNQKQVGSASPDYNNYWSTSAATPLSSATHDEFGSTCYNTTSRRGFPQSIGKYTDGLLGVVQYPAINIGALDDDYMGDGKERKVGYSDMGNQIDCFTPGDGSLTSALNAYTSPIGRWDQRPGGLTSYDTGFSGTSSACPTATGLIATALETNRSWTWQDVRSWLQSLNEQDATTFYQGPDPSTATSTSWGDLNSLMGGTRRVAYNNIAITSSVTLSGTDLSIGGAGLTLAIL